MKLNTKKDISIQYTDVPVAQTVVQLCEIKNIKNIVICSGSRNAPLTNSFVENPFFISYSIVDERSAAFFALGIAQQMRAPAAVVCTSGSALLNFYPAIVEALYSNIPLIVISADRMPYSIDIGDGQTIQQKGVFEPHLVAQAYLTPDVSHATKTLIDNPNQNLIKKNPSIKEVNDRQIEIQFENEKLINQVLNTAKFKSGPVHLNVPMEEPLYGMTDVPIRLNYFNDDEKKNSIINIESYKKQWEKSSKKLVLVGVNFPGTINQEVLDKISEDNSVVLMTETTSNLRPANAINSIDSLIAPIEGGDSPFLKLLQPDILLTFGGMIISKKIKHFLRNFLPKSHWHIDPFKANDTYYCLSDHVSLDPNEFLSKIYFNTSSQKGEGYKQIVLEKYQEHKRLGNKYFKKIPFSDLKAFKTVFDSIPNHLHLQLANSSTVRYAQLFDLPKETEVFCNRGTSGIDGSTSTAVGASLVNKNPTLLITGDLSFFYDINGLWNNFIPSSLRIILINNSGGGIFRILPGEKDTPKFDTYFETIHQRNAKSICKAFGLNHYFVKTLWGLRLVLKSFYNPSNKPKLLEIKTPRTLNDSVLLNYFKAMQKH